MPPVTRCKVRESVSTRPWPKARDQVRADVLHAQRMHGNRRTARAASHLGRKAAKRRAGDRRRVARVRRQDERAQRRVTSSEPAQELDRWEVATMEILEDDTVVVSADNVSRRALSSRINRDDSGIVSPLCGEAASATHSGSCDSHAGRRSRAASGWWPAIVVPDGAAHPARGGTAPTGPHVRGIARSRSAQRGDGRPVAGTRRECGIPRAALPSMSTSRQSDVSVPARISQARQVGAMVDEDRRGRWPIRAARGDRRVRDRREKSVATTGLAPDNCGSRASSRNARRNSLISTLMFWGWTCVAGQTRRKIVVRHQPARALDEAGQDVGSFPRNLDLMRAAPERSARRVESIRQKIFHAEMAEEQLQNSTVRPPA